MENSIILISSICLIVAVILFARGFWKILSMAFLDILRWCGEITEEKEEINLRVINTPFVKSPKLKVENIHLRVILGYFKAEVKKFENEMDEQIIANGGAKESVLKNIHLWLNDKDDEVQSVWEHAIPELKDLN